MENPVVSAARELLNAHRELDEIDAGEPVGASPHRWADWAEDIHDPASDRYAMARADFARETRQDLLPEEQALEQARDLLASQPAGRIAS